MKGGDIGPSTESLGLSCVGDPGDTSRLEVTVSPILSGFRTLGAGLGLGRGAGVGVEIDVGVVRPSRPNIGELPTEPLDVELLGLDPWFSSLATA